MNTVTLNRNMFLSDTGEYGRIFIFSPFYVAIHIIAEELDSTGQPYRLDHHDCLFTQDDDADADTYDDSDADAATYGGDEL